MRTLLLSFLTASLLFSCKEKPAAPVEPAATEKPKTVVFLVTGAENGYLMARQDSDTLRGGAAHVLARWLKDEGHCIGPLKPNGDAACDNAKTVALSTGDNANGQGISSFFKGESTAQAMNLMGYAASAFGNRELDWNRAQFLKNQSLGAFPYLAANVKTAQAGEELNLKPVHSLTRQGLSIAIIGLAARKATVTPMPGRAKGLEIVRDDEALNLTIAEVRKSGTDVVGVVSDGCLHEMPALIDAHADWKLDFIAGRDCESQYPPVHNGTALVYPGRQWTSYASIVVTHANGKNTTQAKLVDVISAKNETGEPSLAKLISGYSEKLDAQLGQVIGFSKTGIPQESKEMSQWVGRALKDTFKTDFALVNRKGVRAMLPEGEFKASRVWDLVPFENEIVVLKVTGEEMQKAMENVEARAVGLSFQKGKFVDSKGKPLDVKKTYMLATTDYLFSGGDNFHFADAAPKMTKQMIQGVVIEWTRGKKSSEKNPLEVGLFK
jgi:5'-nucleotidase / UDP-sugar diphosphatase